MMKTKSLYLGRRVLLTPSREEIRRRTRASRLLLLLVAVLMLVHSQTVELMSALLMVCLHVMEVFLHSSSNLLRDHLGYLPDTHVYV